MQPIRHLIFYKHHFEYFFKALSPKVQEKIDYVLFIIINAEKIPIKFFAHIEGQKGLYEIRVKVSSNIYRIFCCFDSGNLVILFNGFQKKSAKTPKDEIELAVKLMKEYFEQQKP